MMVSREEFEFLPNTPIETKDRNKIMLTILTFLPLEDIKSCKLVNKKWYISCYQEAIFNKWTLVFRANVCPVAEVNDFLTDLNRTRLKVEFIAMNLEEINFNDFGSKITDLTITNCTVNGKTLKEVFLNTPNMICLSFYDRNENDDQDKTLTLVLEDLGRDETFCNSNLTTINCDTETSPMISGIFPRLKNFVCDPSESFTGYSDFLWPDRIERLSDIFIDFDILEEVNLIQFLNMKFLEGKVKCSPCKGTGLLTNFSRFFTAFSSLRDLNLKVYFHVDTKESEVQERTKLAAKWLLFSIIRNCGNLRSLSLSLYELRSGNDRLPVLIPNLDWIEHQEFCRFLHRTEAFAITGMLGDRATFQRVLSTIDGVPKLKYFTMWRLPSEDDIRPNERSIVICLTIEYLFLPISMTKSLKTHFQIGCIQRILDELKNLRSLSISFYKDEKSPWCENRDILGQCSLNHRKLEVFEMRFLSVNEHYYLDPNARCNEFSLYFRNLSSFKLEYEKTIDSECRGKFETLERQVFLWIQRMPKDLRDLKLPDKQHSAIDIDDILAICKDKPKLRTLEWSSFTYPGNRDMTHIFVDLCPNLSKVIVHVYYEPQNREVCDTVEYLYSRTQRTLYRSTLEKIHTNCYRPIQFHSIET